MLDLFFAVLSLGMVALNLACVAVEFGWLNILSACFCSLAAGFCVALFLANQ
jgi:hypothetical protein